MIGTAWIVTGWTVIGGTVFLFGFLFFYDVSPPITSTTPMTTTTPNPTTATTMTTLMLTTTGFNSQMNSTLLSTIMSSTMTSPTQSTTVTTPQVATVAQTPAPLQCGMKGDGITSRIAEPAFGAFLLQLLEGRIIGGTTAVFGEWPWMAYLYTLPLGPVDGGFCGGTLVSDLWVITAAHCIITNDPTLYGAILGAHTISTPTGFEMTREVEQIIIHPNYDPVTFNFDIALIQLNESVTFTEFVRPACIVPPGTNTDNDFPPSFAGAVCSTLGWGFTSSPGGQRSDILMQLNLVVTPASICEIATFQNAADYGNRPVTDDDPKFCAGGQLNEDSCDGDSGGPLLCLHGDGLYYLHGITSYGTEICAQANKPGIYSEVANDAIRSFINNTIFL